MSPGKSEEIAIAVSLTLIAIYVLLSIIF